MSYNGPLSQRDNFGRFQKQATINFTKMLQKCGDKARKAVADKLLETYKDQVQKSYGPRNPNGVSKYTHENIFYDNIGIETDKEKTKIVFKNPNATYPNGRSLDRVHEYLTEGTNGGNDTDYYKFKNKNGEWRMARNYPTPKHYYEEHTMELMKGYLASFDYDQFKNKESGSK